MRRDRMVWLALAAALAVAAARAAEGNNGIARCTEESLSPWRELRAPLPEGELAPGDADESCGVNVMTSVAYDTRRRHQGTGSCWLWGCQAVMWLDYARQFPEEGRAM